MKYNVKNDFSIIKITILNGNDKGNVYEYSSNETQVISLGRKKNLNKSVESIVFSDSSTSKLHLSIVFEESNWVVYDGDGGLSYSVNGVWILVTDNKELFDETIIRVGGYVLKTNIIDDLNEDEGNENENES